MHGLVISLARAALVLRMSPQVVFDFVEKRYPEIQTFNVEGAQVLPKTIVKQVL